MDEELKGYFDRMEARSVAMDQRFEKMDRRFDSMDRRFEKMEAHSVSMEERLVSLMAGEIGTLHTEIDGLRTEMHTGFTRVDERLDRQGLMLAAGTKALGGLLEHVTNSESNYAKILTEMSELRVRVDRLDKRAS